MSMRYVFGRSRFVKLACRGCVVFLVLALCGRWVCEAGELTVDGSLVVKTNLVVNGQVVLQDVVIKNLQPQGDLSMGPYTNRVTQ